MYDLTLPSRLAPSETAAARPTAPEVSWDSIVAGLNANLPPKASAPLGAEVDQHGWSEIVGQLNADLPAAAIRVR